MARLLLGDDNGVTQTGVWEEDGKIILTDTMPGHRIDTILSELAQYQAMPTANGAGVRARIPNYLWQTWRNEFKAGPEQWGVKWAQFLTRKLNSSEYSHLRVFNSSMQRVKL